MPLTKERDTPERGGFRRSAPVAANVKIWAGALVALDAAGRATPGAVAATLVAFGRAAETVDNLGGAAGAKTVLVEGGVFRFANHATDPVTAASLGRPCYIADDETVAATSATDTRSVAGRVLGVEPGGVWVQIA